jgi:hypothetical protein
MEWNDRPVVMYMMGFLYAENLKPLIWLVALSPSLLLLHC